MYICIDSGGIKGYYSYHILKNIISSIGHFAFGENTGGIIGVSAGAIIAGLYAYGILDTMSDDTVKNILIRISSVSWPQSLRSSIKFDMLYTLFKDRTLGESLLPLYIVCTTIHGQPVVFDSIQNEMKHLRVVDIIHASSSVPVIMQTVTIENTLYLDGNLTTGNPITLAYFIARSKGVSEKDIRIFSIGTNTTTTTQNRTATKGHSLSRSRQQIRRNVSLFSLQNISNFFNSSDILFNQYVQNILTTQKCLRISSNFEPIDLFEVSKLDTLKVTANKTYLDQIHRIFAFLYPFTYKRIHHY